MSRKPSAASRTIGLFPEPSSRQLDLMAWTPAKAPIPPPPAAAPAPRPVAPAPKAKRSAPAGSGGEFLTPADLRRMEREAAKRRAARRKAERLERVAIKTSRRAEKLEKYPVGTSGAKLYRILERAQLARHAAAQAWRAAGRQDLAAHEERVAGELAEAMGRIRFYAEMEEQRGKGNGG